MSELGEKKAVYGITNIMLDDRGIVVVGKNRRGLPLRESGADDRNAIVQARKISAPVASCEWRGLELVAKTFPIGTLVQARSRQAHSKQGEQRDREQNARRVSDLHFSEQRGARCSEDWAMGDTKKLKAARRKKNLGRSCTRVCPL